MRATTLLAVLCLGLVPTGCGEAPAEEGFRPLVAEPPPRPEAEPAPDPEIWLTVLEDPTLEAGRQVWTGTCIACHSTGLGGAPLIGRRDLWAPRIEQGVDTLVAHATRGFYGKVGEMPARGGNEALSDAQVRAAVLFMASRAVDDPSALFP